MKLQDQQKPVNNDSKLLFDKGIESLLTADELAVWLNCSSKSVYRLVQAEKIPYLKIGQMLRFQRKTIDEWLSKRRFTRL